MWVQTRKVLARREKSCAGMGGRRKRMLITKDFLDRALTIDTLKKYRDHKSQHHLEKKYVDWAYDKLIGLDRGQAMQKLNAKHNEMMQHCKEIRDYTERNEFVKVMHCIDYELDHGYRAGQTVDYRFGIRSVRTGTIRSISDRNIVRIDDEIISISKIIPEKPAVEIEPEQLSLF